jgi:hypothetical protein
LSNAEQMQNWLGRHYGLLGSCIVCEAWLSKGSPWKNCRGKHCNSSNWQWHNYMCMEFPYIIIIFMRWQNMF